MERKNAWKEYTEEQLAELEELAAGYIGFISDNKTERECAAAAIEQAEAAGYRPLQRCIAEGRRLKAGDKVALVGFGTFDVKDRPERTGKNPRTGEPVAIAATRVPTFKAGKGLKDAVAE